MRRKLEKMNREEVREKFPDISDEQLDWLMDVNGKDINKAKRDGKKDGETSKQSEIDDLNEKLTALEGAADDKLTAEERAAKAEERVAKLEAEYALKTNRVDAEQLFVKAGMTAEDYEPLLETVVTSDSEQTKNLTNQIISLVAAKTDSAVKQAQKDALGGMKKPDGGNTTNTKMTREEFNALGYEGRAALKESDPETYNSFYA